MERRYAAVLIHLVSSSHPHPGAGSNVNLMRFTQQEAPGSSGIFGLSAPQRHKKKYIPVNENTKCTELCKNEQLLLVPTYFIFPAKRDKHQFATYGTYLQKALTSLAFHLNHLSPLTVRIVSVSINSSFLYIWQRCHNISDVFANINKHFNHIPTS